MLILIFIVVLCYLGLIGSLIYGFEKIPSFRLKEIQSKTQFSIVIPFRNEVDNLPALLNSLSALNYPSHLYEILMINDDSNDGSVQRIENFLKEKTSETIRNQLKILNNKRQTNSPKKDAISLAITQAKYEYIVTTDADCIIPKYWLDTFDCYIQTYRPNMIAAPLTLHHATSFLERFQILDILSLQGATIGGFGIRFPFLCNGANLVYKTSVFYEVNGFVGNDHMASGDDIFLLEKFSKYDKTKVRYLLNDQVIVKTNPEPNFKSLKSQRVRWASKTSHYNNLFGKLTGVLILLMNALLICMPLLYAVDIISMKNIIYAFAVKSLVDFLLIFKTARFFSQESYLSSFIVSSFIYPFFNVYVAFVSVFKGFKWKGRPFNT